MNRRESMTTQEINNTNDPQKNYRLGTVSKHILLEDFKQFHGANFCKFGLKKLFFVMDMSKSKRGLQCKLIFALFD